MGHEKEQLISTLIEGGYLKTPSLIEAFRAIDRADFVLPEYKDEAYENYPLPIGQGQTISQPLTVAFMLELLDPRPGEKILDIGSGSGWTTALLAHIVGKKETGRVFSIERIPELCAFGKKRIETYQYISRGITEYFCQDGTVGLAEKSPFDKILASAAASKEIPPAWKEQIKIGGKIVAPIGGSIWLFIKKSGTEWEEKEFPGFVFVPLLAEPRDHGSPPSRKVIKPPGASSQSFKTISIILIIAAFLGMGNEIVFPHASYTGPKTIKISPGMGSRAMGELLKKEGAIRSKWTFVIYVSFLGKASALKPGVYEFEKQSIAAIARELVRGQANERIIVIPEGWRNETIAEYFVREGIMTKEEFKNWTNEAATKRFTETFNFLRDTPRSLGLEGYLFPDTYRIFRSSPPEEIIKKMLENFDRKLAPDLRAEIARQKKNIFDIVTMASLIEKEVIADMDRALVSGILWKRIQYGIPLQVDATISYITGKRSTKISRGETEIDSPYNTYLYANLPKGPIANPGLSAIKAALYPAESPYFYYLSAPDGKTIFSKTLDEHNEAKAKFLTP